MERSLSSSQLTGGAQVSACSLVAFGVMWFVGNAAAGLLYVVSIPLMIVISVSMQFMAITLIIYVGGAEKRSRALERPSKHMIHWIRRQINSG